MYYGLFNIQGLISISSEHYSTCMEIMLRDQRSYHGFTTDGSVGADVNSTSLVEQDVDSVGDTPT